MAPTGMVADGTEPVDGIAADGPGNQELHSKLLMEFVRSAAYEAFCLHRVWQFFEEFLQGPVYLHKRKIIRDTTPGSVFSTPAHYDLVYLRGGTDTVCTSWILIGDIPVEMGGLVYLEGSDHVGRRWRPNSLPRTVIFRRGADQRLQQEHGRRRLGNEEPARDGGSLNTRWLMADFEAGDMMVHSAYMRSRG